LFTKREVCQIFGDAIFGYRDKGLFQLHAFVLMPDHIHVLLTSSETTTLERAVQYIKGGSSRTIGEILKFRLPVWQTGFSDHRIRDAQDFEAHERYIAENPVKRGLVTRGEDYEWSSACGKFRMDNAPQRLKPQALEVGALRRG